MRLSIFLVSLRSRLPSYDDDDDDNNDDNINNSLFNHVSFSTKDILT